MVVLWESFENTHRLAHALTAVQVSQHHERDSRPSAEMACDSRLTICLPWKVKRKVILPSFHSAFTVIVNRPEDMDSIRCHHHEKVKPSRDCCRS